MILLTIVSVRQNGETTAGTVIEALGDPVRRQVVTLLSGGPRRAGEIAAEIGMSAPAISRHLRVLRQALVLEDARIDADARAWRDEILAGQDGLASPR